MPSTFTQDYPQSPRWLGQARSDIARFSMLCGLGSQQTDDVVLAVGEALSNVIEHSGSHSDFTLNCNCDGTTLVISIEDRGKGFAPSPTDGQLQASASRGLGIYLMNRLMDKVEYSFRPGYGTVLRLEKRLCPAFMGGV